MAESLKKGLAKVRVENARTKQSPWAPGAWQAAATRGPKLEKRFPVVISSNSMFPTPASLQTHLNLSDEPAVVRTGRASLTPTGQVESFPTDDVQVCPVAMGEFVQLVRNTNGSMVSVHFDGQVRSAWLARSGDKKQPYE